MSRLEPAKQRGDHTLVRLMLNAVSLSLSLWVGGVQRHTNQYDRNKVKRVGLRQNMYGPLNRELIKAACPLGRLIAHANSHIILIQGVLFKCLLKQRGERRSRKTNEFTGFSRGKCLNPVPSIPIWVTVRLRAATAASPVEKA